MSRACLCGSNASFVPCHRFSCRCSTRSDDLSVASCDAPNSPHGMNRISGGGWFCAIRKAFCCRQHQTQGQQEETGRPDAFCSHRESPSHSARQRHVEARVRRHHHDGHESVRESGADRLDCDRAGRKPHGLGRLERKDVAADRADLAFDLDCQQAIPTERALVSVASDLTPLRQLGPSGAGQRRGCRRRWRRRRRWWGRRRGRGDRSRAGLLPPVVAGSVCQARDCLVKPAAPGRSRADSRKPDTQRPFSAGNHAIHKLCALRCAHPLQLLSALQAASHTAAAPLATFVKLPRSIGI
eukprot:COSAG04_NODE_718_length_10851_cov_8.135231_4_plen_298_part_00